MGGPLAAAGATSEPSEYATLTMDRHITGLWTQRSPLRDADVPYLYGKFYSASRFDSLIDGLNREITSRLTDARRPGSSVWNSNIFPAINSFFPFKFIQNNAEVLRVIADGKDGNIYDATGGGKTTLFTKAAGSGKTRFLGVNTELFFADGIDLKKMIRSALVWAQATSYASDNYIVDTNLNLQLAIGSQQATISDILISANVCTLFFTSATPLTIPDGTQLALSGLTTIPALNGTTQTITNVANSLQVQFAFVHADVAFSVETGAVTTGTGTTGGVQPTWATTLGAITQDGGQQWECRGASIQDWMFSPATAAPSVTQVVAPTLYQNWAANTWYAPLFVIVDSNGNLQQLTTAGTTGGGAPGWSTTVGVTTADGSAVWTCKGSPNWVASQAYVVGDVVQATFSYWITVPVDNTDDPFVLGQFNRPTFVQELVTVTAMFRCTTAGTSGSSTPSWSNGVGTTTSDNTVVWTNAGSAPVWPGATQVLSLATQILDSNRNIQTVQNLGKSNATAPTWATTAGAFTADNALTWLNAAPYGKANTGAWIYGYSGQNSITGDISTSSPTSKPITIGAGMQPVVQGGGFSDPQIDSIVVWRTTQGFSTLIYLDTIPNPGAGQTWIYTDTTPDTLLNPFISAPIALQNNPPPATMTAPCYHLERIWGVVGNNVVYSGGPSTIVGSGNTAFPPLNFIPYPEQVVRLVPITISNGGILVFTTTNVYVILGTGTASNPFYTTIYMGSVGILGYDALDVVGSTLYMLTGKSKFVSLDPSAGYIEAGFPIGDQFLNVTTGASSGVATGALYSPASTYVSWHEQSSGDTAIYIADGAVGWFRFSPVASPETGYLWSPRAAIVGGTSAVQSIETAPGFSQLFIGPPNAGGPILFRDSTVNADWTAGAYASFPSWDTKGNIILCQSGEVAEIAHIALKSKAVGAKPKVSILLGEIAATTTTPFDELSITSADPPDLNPSTTLYSDRYSAMQNGVCPKCDNFQLKVDYGSQNSPDELLMFSVYGAKHAERRQQ
jgi:hypothetical protein